MPTEVRSRWLASVLSDLLEDEQVVIVQGPRAGGKTTLLRGLASERDLDLIDLSDDAVRHVAAADIASYLAGRPRPILVDEYQMLPQILGHVKRTVDLDNEPGAFVLTGSTTADLLPKGTESLAGRSHQMTLYGFSQGEVLGSRERFIDDLYDEPARLPSRDQTSSRLGYAELVVRGGFPEAVRRERPDARRRWLVNYANRVADRDLADLVRLRQPGVFRAVLESAAVRTGQILNLTDIANDLRAGRDAVRTYIELLERVFLLWRVPAFSRSAVSRLARHPKLYLTDSGLATALQGFDATRLSRSAAFGPLLETFVLGEIQKQRGWSMTETRLSHFRTNDQYEVDIVLEAPDGRTVGIEVKASRSVDPSDLRGLHRLAATVGDDFVHGVVLYTGEDSVRLDGPNFTARPISALWAA